MSDLIHITGNVYGNQAALEYFQRLQAQPKDPHAHLRCVWDCPWQCPYLRRGEALPCTGKLRKKELVNIGYVQAVVTEELNVTSTGQIDLFQQKRKVWRHFKSGREMAPYPEPQIIQHFCKEMSLAFVKWLECDQGWEVPAWRILPMTHTKADQEWKGEMAEKHGLRACVFDYV